MRRRLGVSEDVSAVNAMNGCLHALGTHVEYNDDEEVNVGDIVELVEQIFGDETQRRKSGRTDLVPAKVGDGVAVCVLCVVGQRLIEEDPAPGGLMVAIDGRLFRLRLFSYTIQRWGSARVSLLLA